MARKIVRVEKRIGITKGGKTGLAAKGKHYRKSERKERKHTSSILAAGL